MTNLKTKYLGLELKNPVILGSCNFSNNIDKLKKAEDAGVAAVVFKSLFEEQISLESIQLEDNLNEYAERNAEMTSLFPNIVHAGPDEYLEKVRKTKEALKIPVIASLNATYKTVWAEYAKLIEQTGVDALEVNFFAVPNHFNVDGVQIENEQIEILQEIKKTVKIPVSVKLSPFYTNTLNLISKMDKTGVNGFVLFNRLFQPEINTDSLEHYSPIHSSNVVDNRLPLRYAGLLYNEINADICANTGIFSGKDVAKMILAGADCTQVVSTAYVNGVSYIQTILNDLELFMQKNNFITINDFKGKLSKKNTKDVYVYKRAQYVDILLDSENIIKKYPML
ncbi:MAG: dihydroorotate dehydrogenase-like protein [Bacteroidales bacterium]|nr:dihydroorotate dehydrogenase-like protein [Bacteroidales bacterium]